MHRKQTISIKHPGIAFSLALLCATISYSVAQVSPGFIDIKSSNCIPTVVKLVNTSNAPAGSVVFWKTGDNPVTGIAKDTISQVFTEPGNYPVTLFIVNNGDTFKLTRNLQILEPPKAKFEVNYTTGCAPFDVHFTDASVPGSSPIDSWNWDLRNGIVNTSPEFSYLYQDTGRFDLFFMVTDTAGCSGYIERTGFIRVFPSPVVEFDAGQVHSCEPPLRVNYTNETTSALDLEYQWNFGDGATSSEFAPGHTYPNPGNYSVTLSVEQDGVCQASLEKKNFISILDPDPAVLIYQGEDTLYHPDDTLCTGNIHFKVAGAGNFNCLWIINQGEPVSGKEIVYTLQDTGVVEWQLIASANTPCADTTNGSFYAFGISAGFELETPQICGLPTEIQAHALAENAVSWQWNTPGIAMRGGKDTLLSLGASYHEDPWARDIDTVILPVNLKVQNRYGCMAESTKQITAYIPVARFLPNITSGCIPLTVNFMDQSKSVSSIARYRWFINGNMVADLSTKGFSFTFVTEGEYHVQLVIENENGCTDTSTITTILAGDKLKPAFHVSATKVCVGDSIQFFDDTQRADSVDFWEYSSPGHFSSARDEEPNPYIPVFGNKPGFINAQLTVGFNGCISDTVYEDLIYIRGPVGGITNEFSCEEPYLQKIKSNIELASDWNWIIEKDTLDAADSIEHLFGGSGNYPVQVIAVNDTSGCTFKTEEIVKIRRPKASFQVDPVICLGNETLLDASASLDYIEECFVEGFLWDFNDQTPPRRTYNPEYKKSFAPPGEYDIELVVLADNGCADTMINTVLVAGPTAFLKVENDQGCSPALETQLQIAGTDSSFYEAEWAFGDDTEYTGRDTVISHVYWADKSTSFNTTVKIKDIYGCSRTVMSMVQLIKPPEIFYANKKFSCAGDEITFYIYGKTDSVLWDFGDGTPLSNNNVHTYQKNGLYTVTMESYFEGCTAGSTLDDYIQIEQPDAGFNVSQEFFPCYPAEVNFNHISNDFPILQGSWNFDDAENHTANYVKNVTFTYTRPGTYNPELWIETANGCTASYAKEITVEGPWAGVNDPPDNTCVGRNIHFRFAGGFDIESFEWIFGDGNTGNFPETTHAYETEGGYLPYLRLDNGVGCEVLIPMDTIQVFEAEASMELLTDKEVVCPGEVFGLLNTTDDVGVIRWYAEGNLLDEYGDTLMYYFLNEGVQEIGVIFQNNARCRDTALVEVLVRPRPEYEPVNDTVICPGTPTSLLVRAGEDISISWKPDSTLAGNSRFDPVVQPVNSTTYIFSIFDEYGCSNTGNINVYMQSPPSVTRIPGEEITIEIGQEVQFFVRADADVTYKWQPGYAISCTDCNDPVARPFESTNYAATISDGCYTLTEPFNVNVIRDFTLELPDAFTPNGDGINDVIYVEGKKITELIEFKIFNRWGNLVFHTNDMAEGWDGYYRGKKQPIDAYLYYVKARTRYGYETEKSGSFLLLE